MLLHNNDNDKIIDQRRLTRMKKDLDLLSVKMRSTYAGIGCEIWRWSWGLEGEKRNGSPFMSRIEGFVVRMRYS